jgi:CheY-like chemotaxis protein
MANILLADDDAAVRDLVSRALTAEGHKVQATQDGGEAIERLSHEAATFDVLVTDVEMPQVDGVSVAREALKLKPDIAVVLMSGFADQLDRAAELKAKKLRSIAKPFTLEQIKATVRAILA